MVLKLKILFNTILSAIAFRCDSFQDHYHGPEYRWVIEDLDNWLRWRCKADDVLDAQVVRDKLWEIINDRDLIL